MKFAVAATLTKHKPGGVLSINTYINTYEARSKEEAIGHYMLDISERFPEFDVHCRPVYTPIVQQRISKIASLLRIIRKRCRKYFLRRYYDL